MKQAFLQARRPFTDAVCGRTMNTEQSPVERNKNISECVPVDLNNNILNKIKPAARATVLGAYKS